MVDYRQLSHALLTYTQKNLQYLVQNLSSMLGRYFELNVFVFPGITRFTSLQVYFINTFK